MDRKDILKSIRRMVIKIGTTSLTNENGGMNLRKIERLSWILSDLRGKGHEVILVSSGAIAVGSERLRLSKRPRDIKEKQAASSVGQAILMQIYENFFTQYNQTVSQILITKDDLKIEERAENARNTFFTLLNWGVIPIVNENDTTATEELGFSDNDTLSAYVARLAEADLLILLSDIDGLYDKDPHKHNDAKQIDEVSSIDGYIESIAGGSASAFGTGGMATKISAARYAGEKGIPTIIASGNNPSVLFDILDGKQVGTIIYAGGYNG